MTAHCEPIYQPWPLATNRQTSVPAAALIPGGKLRQAWQQLPPPGKLGYAGLDALGKCLHPS